MERSFLVGLAYQIVSLLLLGHTFFKVNAAKALKPQGNFLGNDRRKRDFSLIAFSLVCNLELAVPGSLL